MNQRRFKRSALKDAAGMLRSFHYVAHQALLSHPILSTEQMVKLEPWANLWYEHIRQVFLDSYMESMRTGPLPLISQDASENAMLLNIFSLNKAIYKLTYELRTRPEWVTIPCKGILYGLHHPLLPTHLMHYANVL